MSCCRDGIRESNVVTKVFEVEYVPVEPLLPEDDGLSFQHQMEKERREVFCICQSPLELHAIVVQM